jgi:hypothetical protein
MEHKKSENIKLFLDNKLKDCETKIKKMKRKRKVVKIVYGATIIISVSVSTLAAAVSGSFSLPLLPTVIITSLSTVGAISTAVSTKFNLKNKKEELNNMIARLERLQQQMNYVITCNGDLTETESNKIVKEFL